MAMVPSSNWVVGSKTFADLANIFDEYRVLCIMAEWVPAYSSLPSTLVGANLAGVVDRDTTSPLGSTSAAMGYESVKYGPIDRRLKWDYRMSAAPEANFENSQSPTHPTGSFKLFANGLTVSSFYGSLVGYMTVQMRGTGY